MRRICVAGLAAVALSLAAGCSDLGDPVSSQPPPPEIPTWSGDIQALMISRCASCHGVPPTNNAPDTFRLDAYDRADGGGIDGALEKSPRIRARVFLQRSMPPDGPLPRPERDLIDAWVRGGSPR